MPLPFVESATAYTDRREPSRLGRKLQQHLVLSPSEREALDRWLRRSVRRVRDRTPLVEVGAPASNIHIIIDGWACRYRTAHDGRRQVVAILVPGDVCDFNSFVMRRMDSSIEAIGDLKVACVSHSTLNDLTAAHPRLSQRLWWESMVAASIAREWLVNLGQRNARQRLAHMMCELYYPLEQVDLVADGEMPLPMRKVDLGNACGLAPEHTNRTLRELRAEGLIVTAQRSITLYDLPALAEIAGFTDGYLHVHIDEAA